MGRARVTVLVPNPKEGFYLPGVEAMAAGTLVVCPDCVGNRSYCMDGENCFRPAYDEEAIVAAAERALREGATPATLICRGGRETARDHDLAARAPRFPRHPRPRRRAVGRDAMSTGLAEEHGVLLDVERARRGEVEDLEPARQHLADVALGVIGGAFAAARTLGGDHDELAGLEAGGDLLVLALHAHVLEPAAPVKRGQQKASRPDDPRQLLHPRRCVARHRSA